MGGIDSAGVSAVQVRAGSYTAAEPLPRKSLLHVLAAVLMARRVIAVVSSGFAAACLAIVLLVPKKYTTTVSFTPVAMDLPAGSLASLAGQFGVSLGSDPSTTPDFYASLIQTEDIERALVETPYVFVDGRDTLKGTFIDLYDIDEGDRGKTVDEALQVLERKVLSIAYDRQTSIVQVDVKTKWAGLSYLMAKRLLALIDDFNLHSRQSQAGQEDRFLRDRLDTARAELRASENAVQDFLIRNRSYQGDPQLAFEHDRLQRELGLRQDVYTTLTQAEEQARIRAVRNTPSISLVQQPVPALRFDRRHALLKVLGAFFAGLLLSISWVFVREMLARERSDTPSDYESFARAWSDTRRDLWSLIFVRRRSRVNGVTR